MLGMTPPVLASGLASYVLLSFSLAGSDGLSCLSEETELRPAFFGLFIYGISNF
jgi:hypothetical protein